MTSVDAIVRVGLGVSPAYNERGGAKSREPAEFRQGGYGCRALAVIVRVGTFRCGPRLPHH